jgi:hypothetical protein
MELSGRPLLDTRPDSGLFVERGHELASLADGIRRGLNIAVIGDRGVGKTSLLRALMYRHRTNASKPTDTQPVLKYVRLATAETAGQILSAVATTVLDGDAAQPADASAAQLINWFGDQLADAADAADRAVTPRVVVADDVQAVGGNMLFGSLRDELWQLPLRWVVGTSTEDAGLLLRAPADAFFEQTITLGPLTDTGAVELLRRRLSDVPGWLTQHVVETAAGNPRRILDLVREASRDGAGGLDTATAVVERDQALVALGRPAAVLGYELLSLGGASASDQHLLDRMGWNRARAAQVLGQLEDAGLVRTRTERDGPGRPKKIYTLIDPIDFRRSRQDGTNASE